MPGVPVESLPSGKKSSSSTVTNTKKNISNLVFNYSIFLVLLIEIASMFMRGLDTYLRFWYPLLGQIVCLLFVSKDFIKGKSLKLCQRHKIAFGALSLYYLIGTVSIIFQISNQIYTDVVSYILLSVSSISILLTMFQKRD